MHPSIREEIREASAFVCSRTERMPQVALILGSGLGSLADAVNDAVVIEARDIPHLPASTVSGHKGRLVIGELGGRNVVVVQGRLHMYEGHSLSKVVFPIHLVHALGASCLFVTNASGGINTGFQPGTLMWITDHINWTGGGLVQTTNPDCPDCPDEAYARAQCPDGYYDEAWTLRSAQIADEMGIATRTGTYLWTRGPSYETKAEIRSFRFLGADAVGMSTVPEVIQARRLGMKVIGLSTITNFAAGLSKEPLNHEEVIETGKMVSKALMRLAIGVIELAPVD